MKLIFVASVFASILASCAQAECLVPCEASLVIRARVEDEGPIHVEICEASACEAGTVQPESSGYLDAARLDPFSVSWADSELVLSRSTIYTLAPPDSGAPRPIDVTVTGADGAVVLDRTAVPEVRYEVHCGGFDCPQHRIEL